MVPLFSFFFFFFQIKNWMLRIPSRSGMCIDLFNSVSISIWWMRARVCILCVTQHNRKANCLNLHVCVCEHKRSKYPIKKQTIYKQQTRTFLVLADEHERTLDRPFVAIKKICFVRSFVRSSRLKQFFLFVRSFVPKNKKKIYFWFWIFIKKMKLPTL